MIKFNGATLRPKIPRPFPKPTSIIESKSFLCTLKHIDDASRACAINLRSSLIKIDISGRPRPLQLHKYTGYILDKIKNHLQDDLNLLKLLIDRNRMKINKNTDNVF
jgi:hypothetical protein